MRTAFSVTMDLDLLSSLANYCKDKGYNRSEAITKILEEKLNKKE